MSIGGMNRTPRVAPEDELEFNGWVIPKGTPVSMSTHWMHNDPAVYSDPHLFSPERWLDVPAESEQMRMMKEYYVPFAKGSRQCIGQK